MERIPNRWSLLKSYKNNRVNGDGYVFLSVSDDGVGISNFDQSKLFKLFGTIKSSDNLNKKGCGLGLTICKKIVEQMDGDIQVMSKVNKGTIF